MATLETLGWEGMSQVGDTHPELSAEGEDLEVGAELAQSTSLDRLEATQNATLTDVYPATNSSSATEGGAEPMLPENIVHLLNLLSNTTENSKEQWLIKNAISFSSKVQQTANIIKDWAESPEGMHSMIIGTGTVLAVSTVAGMIALKKMGYEQWNNFGWRYMLFPIVTAGHTLFSLLHGSTDYTEVPT